MRQSFPLAVAVMPFLCLAACSAGSGGDETGLAQTSIPDLIVKDTKPGTGEQALKGRRVTVHYTGWLYDPTTEGNRGRQFDSSRDRGEPFTFTLGAREVIEGWDAGVAGMRTGGVRTLVIPARLAYGERGAGGVIPPNATLVFEVELVGVQ